MKEKTRQVIADMTAEIDRLKRMVVSRDGLIHTSDASLRTTEANLVTMAARVDELEEEKTLLTDMNGRLSTSVRDAIRARDKAVSDAAILREDIKTLERRRTELLRERDAARSQVRRLSGANRELSEQCESLEAKRAELADQLLRLRTAYPDRDGTPSVYQQLLTANDSNDDLRKELLLARDEKTQLHGAFERLEVENERLGQQLDEEIKEANRLSFVISNLTEESETLTGLVGQLRDAIFAAAAGLDVVSVEEGDPSLLEIVAALGEAVRDGKELNEALKVLALILWRLEGYTCGPQAFTAAEVAETRTALKGKGIYAETSAVDGRVIVALKPDEEAS